MDEEVLKKERRKKLLYNCNYLKLFFNCCYNSHTNR
jgi:hypothetical protein